MRQFPKQSKIIIFSSSIQVSCLEVLICFIFQSKSFYYYEGVFTRRIGTDWSYFKTCFFRGQVRRYRERDWSWSQVFFSRGIMFVFTAFWKAQLMPMQFSSWISKMLRSYLNLFLLSSWVSRVEIVAFRAAISYSRRFVLESQNFSGYGLRTWKGILSRVSRSSFMWANSALMDFMPSWVSWISDLIQSTRALFNTGISLIELLSSTRQSPPFPIFLLSDFFIDPATSLLELIIFSIFSSVSEANQLKCLLNSDSFS